MAELIHGDTVLVTMERFTELLKAENEANQLKNMIHQKAVHYSDLPYAEIKLLDLLYSPEDESTEGEKDDVQNG
jgi:hypothetical protein